MVRRILIPRVHRNLNDWDLGDISRLLSLLDGIGPDHNSRDGWEKVISRKGIFTP